MHKKEDRSPLYIPSGSWKKFPLHTTPPEQPERKRRTHQHITSKSSRNDVLKIVRKNGLPSVPATIGRLRIERIYRGANDFGLKRRCLQHSFEINQSFPLVARKLSARSYDIDLITPVRIAQVLSMDKIRVDGANGLRFSTRRKGCFTPGTGSPFSGSFVASASETILRVPQIGINPNKAVFTIDSKTSQILIVNHNACELLGYTPKELCDLLFSGLLTNKNKSHVSALAEGQLNSEDGTMVLLSGKVVEMNTKYGTKVAVSLWIRQIDSDGRCLAVAEPVERRVAQIVCDRNGCIMSGDYEALMLFQLDSLDHFCGLDIQSLVPAIQLPDADTSHIAKHIRKQKATGKTTDGVTFPLCLMIGVQDGSGTDSADSGVSNSNGHLYCITIWVFQNISGLLVIDEAGFIESCNHHFSMLMFGYSQTKILGRHISDLIPNFGQDIEYLGNSRSRNATSSSLDNGGESDETETDPVYYENDGFVSSTSECGQHLVTAAPSVADEMAKTRSEPVCIAIDEMPVVVVGSSDPTTKSCHSSHIISKSISDNILLAENSENNKNVANLNKTSFGVVDTKVATMKSVGPINFISGLDNCDTTTTSASASKHLYDISDTMLTPVNEPNDFLLPCTNAIADASTNKSITSETSRYHSVDIGDAVKLVISPAAIITTRDKCVTPKPNQQQQQSFEGNVLRKKIMTSTPDARRFSACMPAPPLSSSGPGVSANASSVNLSTPKSPVVYNDGKYKGEAIHCDENVLDILYTISSQTLPCGRKVFCVWICRDPDLDYELDDDDDGRHQNLTLTFNSIASTIENSLGQAIKNTAAQNSSRPNSVSLVSQCEDDQVNGEFLKHYTTLKQIGKGAYGYVKMAYRHTDRLLVVTKFILKEKLTPQFMIMTEDKKDIPMEIYLLTTVKHPNIVTVYDIFENDRFFQLVMEKHGSGMDLFEFIDRRPMMDEKLGCFIFRQIANAVDYLHSLHILHRDIKDENIIIDQNFHVKLIDFGSATFMEEGKLFSTFYGTTEYCSPEVLAGNKYAGPELEMWSLGVTLYVLMFFENPFLDIEETLRAELSIPDGISAGLAQLLQQMLDKNPKTRCTMRQLQENAWIGQEIVPTTFNFGWIVPCEAHEANPEKYFTGAVYSSTTGLSTMSPQDSLSLVDEDSIIDPEDDIDDEAADAAEKRLDDEDDDDEDEKSLPSQDDQLCDQCVSEPISSCRPPLLDLRLRNNSQTLKLSSANSTTTTTTTTNSMELNTISYNQPSSDASSTASASGLISELSIDTQEEKPKGGICGKEEDDKEDDDDDCDDDDNAIQMEVMSHSDDSAKVDKTMNSYEITSIEYKDYNNVEANDDDDDDDAGMDDDDWIDSCDDDNDDDDEEEEEDEEAKEKSNADLDQGRKDEISFGDIVL